MSEMIELEIVTVNNYEYNLKDEEQHKYVMNLEFFDIEDKLEIGDHIYINRELLDPKYVGYSTNYTFGSLENGYGKENISISDIDVIRVVIKDKEIYLKRLYG